MHIIVISLYWVNWSWPLWKSITMDSKRICNIATLCDTCALRVINIIGFWISFVRLTHTSFVLRVFAAPWFFLILSVFAVVLTDFLMLWFWFLFCSRWCLGRLTDLVILFLVDVFYIFLELLHPKQYLLQFFFLGVFFRFRELLTWSLQNSSNFQHVLY